MAYKLISEDDVKKILNTADEDLHECFDMLMDFRNCKNDICKIIFQFQPLLAETLLNLMEFYSKLSKEKNILINAKSDYAEDVFSKEMAINGRFMKAISTAIDIGKSMGDAFAWFFYRDNREELEKHFAHTSTGLYVFGVGGHGELEFIKKNPCIDGFYVLYHGITTTLRIGDFSLYDLNHGIVGIGELKTKKEGNNLQISAFISTRINIQVHSESKNKQHSFEERLRLIKQDFPRIEKQLKAQINFLKTTKVDATAVCAAAYEYNMINTLTPESPFMLNSDRSLMVIATWSKYQSMYDVLIEKEEASGLLKDEIIESARLMVLPKSPYNQFHIGRLTTASSLLTIPILWWHINDYICEDIYFLRVGINTVFNPARLLNYFAEDGFSITISGELNKIKLQKRIADKKISFGNFSSLCFLITNSFMTTYDAYSSVKQVINEVEKEKFPINSRIDMHINLDNFVTKDTDVAQKNETDGKEYINE